VPWAARPTATMVIALPSLSKSLSNALITSERPKPVVAPSCAARGA
jgi:hypothetical protein